MFGDVTGVWEVLREVVQVSSGVACSRRRGVVSVSGQNIVTGLNCIPGAF